MPEFENDYDKFITKVIDAEVRALNSEKGQEIVASLLETAKEKYPDLTPKKWSTIKQQFLVFVFSELLKENPEFQKHFAHLVFENLQSKPNETP